MKTGDRKRDEEEDDEESGHDLRCGRKTWKVLRGWISVIYQTSSFVYLLLAAAHRTAHLFTQVTSDKHNLGVFGRESILREDVWKMNVDLEKGS